MINIICQENPISSMQWCGAEDLVMGDQVECKAQLIVSDEQGGSSYKKQFQLCSGDLSFVTVFNQRCKVRQSLKTTYKILSVSFKPMENNMSSCVMGSDGFSFCDTELFYREGGWFDWDLCSLCYNSDQAAEANERKTMFLNHEPLDRYFENWTGKC